MAPSTPQETTYDTFHSCDLPAKVQDMIHDDSCLRIDARFPMRLRGQTFEVKPPRLSADDLKSIKYIELRFNDRTLNYPHAQAIVNFADPRWPCTKKLCHITIDNRIYMRPLTDQYHNFRDLIKGLEGFQTVSLTVRCEASDEVLVAGRAATLGLRDTERKLLQYPAVMRARNKAIYDFAKASFEFILGPSQWHDGESQYERFLEFHPSAHQSHDGWSQDEGFREFEPAPYLVKKLEEVMRRASLSAVAAAPSHPITASASTLPTPSPAPSAPLAAGAAFNDPPVPLVGSQRDEAIANMEVMGFQRSEIDRAVRAAYFRANRTIEYLLNGIPKNVQREQAQA